MTEAEALVVGWGVADHALAGEFTEHVAATAARSRRRWGVDPQSPAGQARVALVAMRVLSRGRNLRGVATLGCALIENGMHDPDIVAYTHRLAFYGLDLETIKRSFAAVALAGTTHRRTLALMLRPAIAWPLTYIDLVALHDRLWGFSILDMPTLQDALEAIPKEVDPRGLDRLSFRPELVDFAYNARPRIQSRAEFEDELVRIYLRWSYVQYLRTYCGKLAASPTTDPLLLARARALVAEADAMVRFADPDLADRITNCRRPVVLAQYHGGMDGLDPHARLRANRPWTLVGRNLPSLTSAAGPADSFDVPTTGPTMTKDFAKLIKAMRKGPRIIDIYPDGRNNASLPGELFGQPFPVGGGAAALSYYGNADVYFTYVDWTHEGVVVHLTRLCSPEDSPTYEAHEALFAKAYTRCLEEVMTGNPAPMGDMVGIIWGTLFRSLAPQAAATD